MSTTILDSTGLCPQREVIASSQSETVAPLFTLELTPREREVLKLLVQGLSNAEIAATLCVSSNTVKTHLRSIFIKLDVGHRVQAAVIAIEQGLV